ncbi:MAG: hypothetical protein ACOX6M_00145 [Armatimonadota bacterium]
MPMPLMPNAENCTLAELDVAIRCSKRQQDAFRMQAIKALLLGVTRSVVAELFAVARSVSRTLSVCRRSKRCYSV